MAYTPKLNHIAGACALLFCINSQTFAQSETQLSPVVVTGEKGTGYVAKGAMIGGPGGTEEVELKDIPSSINVLTKDLLDDRQVKLISEAVRTDASIGDYYATIGYYENLSIRGFPLDLATSFRMNGMALTGEQNFAFENKDRVEILKGVSAMQAGASSPGGLINFVTKRPKDVMSATLGTGERGTRYMAADYGTYLNKEKSLGIRINAANEDMKPFVKGAEGERKFVSLAADAKLSNKTFMQFDIEYQDKNQRGVSGLMLLGNSIASGNTNRRLPDVPADIMLNYYPWVQPNETQSTNSGLKIDHELSDSSKAFFSISRSQVNIDDRQAYATPPSGWRTFKSDGTFYVNDYRSEGERRINDQIQIGLSQKYVIASIKNELTISYSNLHRTVTQAPSIWDGLNTDNIYNLNPTNVNPISLGNPSRAFVKTLNHEQNSVQVNNISNFNEKIKVYSGLRYVNMSEKSFAVGDGSEKSNTVNQYYLPQIGLAYLPNSSVSYYSSYSRGLELGTNPISTSYTNSTILPPKLTSQYEIGSKYTRNPNQIFSAALFVAERPNEFPIGCDGSWCNSIVQDGKVRHQGLEISVQDQSIARLKSVASIMYLKAEQYGATQRTGEDNPNGSQAIGIPKLRAVIFTDYLLPNFEKLSIQSGWTYVSSKNVTIDGSIKAPSYNKFDAGLKYVDKLGTAKSTYRLFVENLFDKFYWRDVSQTYGANTVYPGTPRIFRATATFDF
jgi:iron complex outermembrane receptor protein